MRHRTKSESSYLESSNLSEEIENKAKTITASLQIELALLNSKQYSVKDLASTKNKIVTIKKMLDDLLQEDPFMHMSTNYLMLFSQRIDTLVKIRKQRVVFTSLCDNILEKISSLEKQKGIKNDDDLSVDVDREDNSSDIGMFGKATQSRSSSASCEESEESESKLNMNI